MSASDARRTAWRALSDLDAGRALDEVLSRGRAVLPDARERAFFAELLHGALRWRGRYDHIIDQFARRPSAVRREDRFLLHLALHQLLACDGVPDYAAVDQSVRMARRRGGAGRAGFINGLLQAVRRRLGQDHEERRQALPGLFPPSEKPREHLAAWTSHPVWLVERWLRDHGPERAATICDADNVPAPLWLHVLKGADPAEVAAELEARGLSCRFEPGSRALRLRDRLDRSALAELLSACPDLIVQDRTVQEATDYLAAGLEGPVLDLCAAPGGKTLHLRRLLPASELVVAADLSAERLERVAENLERVVASPVAVVSADGRRAPFRPGAFGTVLLDGPCTGTGVLRRHPEGRWRLRPEAIAESADRLLELAVAAAELLRPGGRLLYATCSLEPEENEGVLERLRAEVPELVPETSGPGGAHRRWWPEAEGGDGFFAARMRRRETP